VQREGVGRRLLLSATTAAAALLGACVHIGVPPIPSFGPGHGDTATFVIDGGTTTVTQSGSITVSGTGSPLDYSGPLGCRGRYFEADETDTISMDFRYSSQDAFLLVGNDLYHFGPPDTGGGVLDWSEDFGDRSIEVKVSCALPPSTAPLSPEPGATATG
jgi:hypothetical protein